MLRSLGAFGGDGGSVHSMTDSLPVTDGGLDAVRKTLKMMGAIIRKYSSDATTVNTARQILMAGGVADIRSQRRQALNLIHQWVRDRIAYVYDPLGVELLQTPPQTLKIGTGDCDDKVILELAMLASVGFETELLGVGGEGRGWDPGCAPQYPGGLPAYSHVIGAVKFGKPLGRGPSFLDGWLTLDPIVRNSVPGWKPPGIRVIMPWHI